MCHRIWSSCLAVGLATTLVFLGPVVTTARAGAMSTGTIIEAVDRGASTQERDRVHRVLDRPEVTRQLARLGVPPDEAHRRIEAMSDREVEQLNGRLDHLPAGGLVGEIVAAILIVFLVLLFTDLIGATDVFPWVRKH